MTNGDTEVLIIGGGAAGIAAGRRLADAGIPFLIVEARTRLGGRAWTDKRGSPFPLDFGCGWLHSGDRNPWTEIASAQGHAIDKTPPPWMRASLPIGFSLAEQNEFVDALGDFFDRLRSVREDGPDQPAARFLEPGGRWNALINAVSTYLSGVELGRASVRDFARYSDSGVNWRVVEGYGTVIAAHAAGLPIVLGCPVTRIDHGGSRLKSETGVGTITCDAVIVTVPSSILADEALEFTPRLPEKVEAAAGLPLGLADKLFLSLSEAEEFEAETRLFGRTDSTEIGSYHVRPFGRPIIEGYFGGRLAAELEAEGETALLDFAVSELTGLLGTSFASRIRLLGASRWKTDPLARGSYSYALPGRADDRATLAAPVDGRLFFAGEACSRTAFSTAHGAYLTGVAAAEQSIAARRGKR